MGRAADGVIAAAGRAVGVDGAVEVFRELTREAFAELVPWPSAQLSALSGGVPLELSTAAGRPALRYACEVGDPLLPSGPRAASAVGAIRRTAVALGLDAAWARVAPGVAVATDPALDVPDSCRFRVWGGIDQRPGGPPLAKVYLNLLNAELGAARRRLDTVLDRAGIPVTAATAAIFDRLDAAGFAHEVGFGLGADGRIAAKAYWELSGWQPALVRDLLDRAGLPPDLEPLRPELPGVLRESLARRSRAGIALRLDPADGTVRELTVAAAFPPALVGEAEIGRRVRAWTGLGGIPAGSVHSLFTRTVSRDDAWTTVYHRPPFPLRMGYGHRDGP